MVAFIEIENLSKSFKEFKALDGVSFGIEKGEVFGYIGPNGAGKTTTIKILVGLIKTFSGSVLVGGEPVDPRKFHEILGYLPQDAGFQEWRTVDHVLKTFGQLSGMDKHALGEAIPAVLGRVGLGDVRGKKVTHLSGGMVQKLRLAQAILHDPPVLVLDEPMSGLDPASRFHVRGIIKDLATAGKTIMFSSHVLSDVQDICDTLAILDRGHVMQVGTPSQLREEFNVGNVVEITVADPTHGQLETGTLSFVDHVETAGSRMLVHFKSGVDVDTSMLALLGEIVAQGVKARSVTLVRPSLEDVYMNLLGGVAK